MWRTSAYIDINACEAGIVKRPEDYAWCSFAAAVGIRSRIHFNRYYLAPLLEKGLIVRTDPEHPNSPHQEYERT
jgi:hypothetical protein